MRSAIVTGAGAGIGRAVALALAARDWRVLLCDIDGDAAARAAADAGGAASPVTADITDDHALAALIASADSLTAVVHCAALFPRISLADTRIGDFDRVMAVNLRAAVQLTLHAARAMCSNGSVVFLTSGSGLLASAVDPFQQGFALYGASKAALDRWVAGVAPELAAAGIFASTITPGAIVETPGLARAGVTPTPGAATISAERVAEAIVRLAEDRSGRFAGQRLNAAAFEDWR
ncbi:SDR family oxidoreductase [Sphingomonas sp. M1-B02]|uniref:SDR family oxidoreductase n=1 Tax=Sphingomonas sp. M1-B02 TaxID=3114300 RepID=UPI00223F1169|nr:SDR family oxidoreductase [Sphingomonas sp. S6-11]UZK67296.1 SDR family oxidoreductase [Sphingomonas sp. S6-11]